jgi:glutamine synthetase
MTPKEVLDLAKKNKVKIVDIKFTDLLGTWQHFSVPTSELGESLFEDDLKTYHDFLVPVCFHRKRIRAQHS